LEMVQFKTSYDLGPYGSVEAGETAQDVTGCPGSTTLEGFQVFLLTCFHPELVYWSNTIWLDAEDVSLYLVAIGTCCPAIAS
jgi:hypothetical protein